VSSGKTQEVGVARKIVDFHLDESLDWVADLECGHQQHLWHNPLWTTRHWVTTPQGRYEHLGCGLVGLYGGFTLEFSQAIRQSSRGQPAIQKGGRLLDNSRKQCSKAKRFILQFVSKVSS
jgi:hypothetical protein